ncbi:Extracellular matrix protein FRAS1 [Merluccius polli]|uniref:Extracellular matrix protein FRAS1 n=1 Tax=Merluccius polli TaxID=89951 RepID=A0AA47N5E9_MERPO|nr:Extracellular matrix protein FRAS1 [Merluccius polli]
MKANKGRKTATSWRGTACETCTCYGDITVCLPPRCPNPRCDYQKGERLRIPGEGCCPECVSTSHGSCQHQGLTYGDNSQWSPSPCEEYQTLRTLTGHCCPLCVHTGASCSVQGELYSHGDMWSSSTCSRCVCEDGDITCSAAECQPVTCQPEENLVIPPGGCCPQCVSNPCLSGGEQHQHGEQWQKDSCTTCVCDRGQSRCHTQTCPDITCPKCSVSEVLCFLQDMIDKGRAFSTIKVYLAAISACHVGFGRDTAGWHPLVRRFMKGARRRLFVSKPLFPSWDLSSVLDVLCQQP